MKCTKASLICPGWAEYVKLLMENADDPDARFVVWFVPREYDPLWDKLSSGWADELLKMWKDTGLVDGSGKPRKALGVWDAWLAVPVKKSS